MTPEKAPPIPQEAPLGPPKGEAKPVGQPSTPPKRSKVFDGITKETEDMLAERPDLARLLEQHPDAADLFKLCKSKCFPDFMTAAQLKERLAKLDALRAVARKKGIDLDEGAIKELLHSKKTVKGVDRALDEIQQALEGKIRYPDAPAEAESALVRAQPKTPRTRSRTPRADDPAKQFEGMPDELPEGHGDLFEQPGMEKSPTPGGRPEKPRTEAGKYIHKHAEIFQNDPKLLDDLIKKTGDARIFSERLPEGMVPEYTIPHPDLPVGRRPRIDRLWRKGDTIYELKPNTESALKGEVQAQQYAEWMNKYDLEKPPGGWKWKVVEYDQQKVLNYFEDIGILPKPPK
jgi:hypothetical protein